jgi:hypothetical protein
MMEDWLFYLGKGGESMSKSRKINVVVAIAALFTSWLIMPRLVTAEDQQPLVILFEQPWPGGGSGSVPSDTTYPPYQAADNFSIQEDAFLTAIKWWGRYCEPNQGCGTYPRGETTKFIVRIFEDDEGQPAAIPFYPPEPPHNREVEVQLLDLGSGGGQRFFELYVELPLPVALKAGKTYWLSLLERDKSAVTYFDWNKAAYISSDNFALRTTDGSPWRTPIGNLSFVLYGEELIPPNIEAVLKFFDASITDGTLEGYGPGKSANGRLNALRNMLEMAADLINIGDIEGACEQLRAALKKCDGVPKPPDFVTGPAASELYDMIIELMAELGCE